jgi:hypothetical protein
MSVFEINNYIAERSLYESNNVTILSWKIVNFVSMMITGKLKDLYNYLPKQKIAVNPSKDKLIDKAKEKARQLGHIK